MTVEEYNDIKRDIIHFSNRLPPLESCSHNDKAACHFCNPMMFNPSREQSKLSASIALGNKIMEAKEKYYKDGSSHLTDYEYDALEGSLRAIDPMNPVLNKVG